MDVEAESPILRQCFGSRMIMCGVHANEHMNLDMAGRPSYFGRLRACERLASSMLVGCSTIVRPSRRALTGAQDEVMFVVA